MINSSFKDKPRRPLSKQFYWDVLDVLTSKIVRRRQPYCATCGTDWKLTCSHIFSRGHGPTRFDIDPGGNNTTQCQDCNVRHNSDRGPLFDWYVKQYGERALDDLGRRAVSEKHWGYVEIVELVERYKLILKEEREAAA